MSTLDQELDRLASINDIPRHEFDAAVASMRDKAWRLAGRVESDEELLDALKLGIAADFAQREQADAVDARPERLAFADVGVEQVRLERRGLRRAVGRLMGVVER